MACVAPRGAAASGLDFVSPRIQATTGVPRVSDPQGRERVMPPCQTPAYELLRFNRSRRANTSNLDLDAEDGTVVILGYDQHYTLSWDQIGTPTGYQDLVELREAVVEELRRDNVECVKCTAEDIVLTLHDPNISLESDAPLYGDEGREVRDKIKLSGEIAILPAGIQRGIDGSMVLTRPSHFRNNDTLPDKPNYHRQPVEMLSRSGQVSSGSIFDVKDSVQMVLSTDTKAVSYEVETRCLSATFAVTRQIGRR